ncbi:hypothetical protein BV006_00621 [Haemophilus influenzae]|nr:hypothetical protein BV166_01750 [Haemophilus influenzae]PRK60002.1 hypothetical protein BV167_01827 [Haemophilus influenzae]PRM09489.1 hypothetical protein BV006_00621 [Haemophilus influenzae]
MVLLVYPYIPHAFLLNCAILHYCVNLLNGGLILPNYRLGYLQKRLFSPYCALLVPIKGRFLGRLSRFQNGKTSRRAHHLLKFDNCQRLPVSPHLKLSAYNHAQALIYLAISPIRCRSLCLYQIPKHSRLYCQLMHEYAQRLHALVRQSAVLLLAVFYNSSFPPMPYSDS